MRYTEYHNGIAVIKDKTLLKEAMAKLAKYEDEEVREKMLDSLNIYCSDVASCKECVFKNEDCDFSAMDDNELKTAYEMMLEVQSKR